MTDGPEGLPSIDDLEQQKKDLMEALASYKEIEAALSDEQKSINRTISEHQALIRQAEDKKREGQERLLQLRRDMRKVETEVNKASRLAQQAQANKDAAERFSQLSDEFDAITLNLPWREWALDHQIVGAKKLAVAKRGILADKMGLGKTLTSLIYADMLKARRILIVAPNDVCTNFMKEIAHWAPHRTVVSLANNKPDERAFKFSILKNYAESNGEFIVVVNYEAWRKDKSILDSFISLKFDTLIMDEAHNIKGKTTAAYRGLDKVVMAQNMCPMCGDSPQSVKNDYGFNEVKCPKCHDAITLMQGRKSGVDFYTYMSIQNVLPMTGTPIINRPQDLWTLLSLIDRQAFHKETQFLDDYCMRGYDNKWKFRPGGLESLVKKLSSRFVQRDRKTAGITLPPPQQSVYELNLDPELYPNQAKVMKDLNDFAAIVVGDKAVSMLYIIEVILRQRQACTWPAGIVLKDDEGIRSIRVDAYESIKIDKCIDSEGEGLIPEILSGGERIVLFSQFKTPLVELERRLNAQGISVARLDGDTPDTVRSQIADDFDAKVIGDNPARWDVLLANYKTGGVGLNFTAANHAIILDEEWSPAKRDQAYARIDRVGQTRETNIHILRIARSIDTWMAKLIEQKEDLVGGFETEVDMMQQLRDIILGGEAA